LYKEETIVKIRYGAGLKSTTIGTLKATVEKSDVTQNVRGQSLI
jgi:hypothetical protein